MHSVTVEVAELITLLRRSQAKESPCGMSSHFNMETTLDAEVAPTLAAVAVDRVTLTME